MHGGICAIKKNGSRSEVFPLLNARCLFGKSHECDIIINVSNVSDIHTEIFADDKNQVTLSGVMAFKHLSELKHQNFNNFYTHNVTFVTFFSRFESRSGFGL